MIWILIFFIKVGYAGGTTTVEFNSEEACRSALEVVVEEGRLSGADFAVCVPKG
jgi:hypothetical protein